MTPSQLDHLRLIDTHLAKLLDIAAKRTAGCWGYYWGWDLVYSDANGERKMIADCVDRKEPTEQVRDDMAFIASCAGNAEAGWRATRAAIENGISALNELGVPQPGYPAPVANAVEFITQQLESILAAFPLESLKP